jgi:hypothetical protein
MTVVVVDWSEFELCNASYLLHGEHLAGLRSELYNFS